MSTRAFLAVLVALAASGCDTGVTLIPGSSPRQVTAVSGISDVTLFWEDVPGASGYRVYSGRKLDGAEVLLPVSADDFEARGGQERDTLLPKIEGLDFPLVLDDGDPYAPASFTVVALRGNGVSAPSEEVLGWRQEQYYGRIPVWTVQSSGTSFGVAMSGIGDMNDDGYEDVAIGAPGANGGSGAVYFYTGSPSGLVQSRTFTGSSPGDEAGFALAASDSWNDGRASVFVGAPGNDTVYVVDPFAGTAPTIVSVLTVTSSGSRFGSTVADAGNLDGDLVPFRSELAIGAPSFGGGGAVFVYGGLSGASADADSPAPTVILCLDTTLAPIRSVDGQGCGGTVESWGGARAAAGNVENDPWDDLVIGVPGYDRGAVVLYRGFSPLTSGEPMSLAQGPNGVDQESSGFGAAVASVGDADGDDLEEIVVGASGYDDEQNSAFDRGRIAVFPGVPEFPFPGDIELLEGVEADSRLGGSLLFARNIADAPYGLLVGVLRETDAQSVAHRVVRVFTAVRPEAPVGPYATANELSPPIVAPGEPGSIDESIFAAPVGLGAADVDGDGVSDILVSDSASGVVQLFISIPGRGPEVHAGPRYETRVGEDFTLSLATFIDPQASRHRCHVEWELRSDAAPPDSEGEVACNAETVRTGLVHTYLEPGEFVVRLTVTALDGRKGQAITRVVARP